MTSIMIRRMSDFSSNQKQAHAAALFANGNLSLAQGARLADMPLAAFISYVWRLGVPAVSRDTNEVLRDLHTLDRWLEEK
jgi:predicted HTH domain antitoxin